ncbi:MAG: transaldolase, partial [Chthoniobacterales bacterium]
TELEKRSDLDATQIYEQLAIRDIQDAADVLRPVYDQTKRRDGYVSLEVSPYLAHKTQETIEEARRLWKAVGRENLMIKIPGTSEGIPAFQQAISEGINVNVTLLFAQDVYERVARAYIAGLEAFAKTGGDVSRIASVASFFVSRIDSLVDTLIDERIKKGAVDKSTGNALQGKVAIANAKLAYQSYKQIFGDARWQALAQRGAQTQRVLWASTGTKNPAYSDVLYIEELIGPDTVNTIPPATYDAYRDHGHPRATLEKDVEGARQAMANLAKAGISMKEVTDKLTDDGVKLFEEAFDKLLEAVNKRAKKGAPSGLKNFSYKLPADLDKEVLAAIDDWKKNDKVKRLWARDASLWTKSDESKWLGWLGVVEDQLANLTPFKRLAEEVGSGQFTDVVLLGMGGSSLCVEVLELTFGHFVGHPQVHVLDSTDPAQIRTIESQINLGKSLFIVSSKSG